MNIGMIGNRTGWTYSFVKKKLLELNVYKSDIIISGGAEGVDTFAQKYAKEIGARINIIYPDPNKPIPQRYFDRNKEIVLLSDVIIAFNKNNSERTGTYNTINYAKNIKGKKIIIIMNEND